MLLNVANVREGRIKMLKRLRGFDVYVSDDSLTALKGESISGDEYQRLQGIIVGKFMMPDKDGKCLGLPHGFFMVAELITMSSGMGSGGGADRRNDLRAGQESTVYRIYASKDARVFFQRHGFFSHLPRLPECDELISIKE